MRIFQFQSYNISDPTVKNRILWVLLLCLFQSTDSFSQQTEVVDFLAAQAIVNLEIPNEVNGVVSYTFQVKKGTDSIFVDAVAFKETEVWLNDSLVPHNYDGKRIVVSNKFVADTTKQKLKIKWSTKPKQTMYFVGDQIWTQGQGKYTSHWFPSFDDMNEKVVFDLWIQSAKGSTVVSNGKIVMSEMTTSRINSTKSYNGIYPKSQFTMFDMDQPMSSYLLAVVVGDYVAKKITSNSGIPIYLYYQPDDKNKVEYTYKYTKEIFDFLETEIGVPYPWVDYKQVPVRDFLYAGMENTAATVFSEAFLVTSKGFNDRNYVNVNAHELAHQWFGNLVTETEGTHHWLHEGFATYYALLAERELFGDDYYYWKLLQSAEQLEGLSQSGKGESLLNPKASSLTFYEKGAWALHMLKELIGEDAFKTAIQNYLKKHQFKNVTTDDFLAEVKLATLIDISQWEADWLRQSAFKAQQALESLVKSEFINDYFKASALRGVPLSEKKLALESLLMQNNDYLGQEAVYQLASEPIKETLPLYKLAMKTDNLMIRQAIAASVQDIPLELKPIFESLLEDRSYVTMEYALAGLTAAFPEDRLKYLEPAKYVVGFQNKNIKLLWLAIAISSEVYGASANEIFLSELKSYTAADFSFEVRQKAFEYVFQMRLFDSTSLKNLVNACVHHNWRFRNMAREMLKKLLEDEKYRNQLEPLMDSFSEKEKNYLDRISENK